MMKSWRKMAIQLDVRRNEVHEREDRRRVHDSPIQSRGRFNRRKMMMSVGPLRRLIDLRRVEIDEVLNHAPVFAGRHGS